MLAALCIKMKSIDKLIDLLDSPDDEIWGNVYIDYAEEIFENEPNELISTILKQWSIWPENRQEHLACILGYVGSPLERELILQMVNSDNKLVANRAKEALDELNGNA